jgi:hypothetical protein
MDDSERRFRVPFISHRAARAVAMICTRIVNTLNLLWLTMYRCEREVKRPRFPP